MHPRPNSVSYNDWRQVTVAPLEAFTPVMPVSVIIPYYQTPAEVLERTLAALEVQTYPRDLFEVVIVDDGSEPPLKRPHSVLPDVKVVRQERCGYGRARARHTGVRAAAHDILLFLDSDILAEREWMAAHARWHHAVSDALTLGFCYHVSVNDVDAETIRRRPGSLKALFSDRRNDRPWFESTMARTNGLTSRADDVFRIVCTGNLGVSRGLYELTGGFDESLRRYLSMEDTEFGYRAYTCGGLLVPLADARTWHQGRWREGRRGNRTEIATQLIAHPRFRSNQPGRIFKVPQYVVTVQAGHYPTDQIIGAVVNVLADRVHDLVVIIDMPADGEDERLVRLREEFGADARVRIAPTRSSLDEFPASPFHVTLPATVLARDLVHRLRSRLGSAITVTSFLPDDTVVSMTRTWALHRARRTGKSVTDFGEALTIPARKLKLKRVETVGYRTKWRYVLYWMQDVHGPGDVRTLLKGLAMAVRWRWSLNR